MIFFALILSKPSPPPPTSISRLLSLPPPPPPPTKYQYKIQKPQRCETIPQLANEKCGKYLRQELLRTSQRRLMNSRSLRESSRKRCVRNWYGNCAQGTIISAAAVVARESGTFNEVSLIGVFTRNIFFFLLSYYIFASGVG